ncbi:hypothetical protein DBR47_02770 [Paucibacter sp. KBW04]|uniref:hypothetical protein n=1 Tax=Paucibacter sp. KBW04 TaxID=2153361 RepID=UPI000F57970F|nr:hypothetical protein [Paucibacter sp. KBW04]RQO63473.1 hypothetical protein DBR47_02770 [Paucibacter sp. KBW04]
MKKSLSLRSLGLTATLIGVGALSACSSPANLKSAADDDVQRTYVTGSRIPYKGAQPIAKADKEFAKDALREQNAIMSGSIK